MLLYIASMLLDLKVVLLVARNNIIILLPKHFIKLISNRKYLITKITIVLFFGMILSHNSYSQDTTSINYLKKKLNGSFPKRRFTLTETTTDNFKNTYQFDKKTKILFNVFSNKLSHDTSFRFFYLNDKVAYCEMDIWPDPKKRKGIIFGYYVSNGNLIPLGKQEKLSTAPIFLIEKAAELYNRGNKYLLLNQPD